MSKIGIIGDTHFDSSSSLGRTDPNTQMNSRLIDFLNTFNGIVDNFEKQEVRHIVITGDIFNSRNPNPITVNEFSKCLKRTTDKGIEVVLISGNHDTSRSNGSTTLDFFNTLQVPRVSIFTDIGIKTFNDFTLVLIPYFDRKQFGAETNDQAVKSIQDRVDGLIKDVKGPIVGVAHLVIENGMTGYGNESENFSINEIVLPVNAFPGFDFLVSGHVHAPEILRRKKPVMYVGSMEKLTFGDRGHKKSTLILDTDNLDNFKVIPTKTRELFELNFDYSASTPFKSGITDKVIQDIENFGALNKLEDSIARLVVRMNESDIYYVNQERIRQKLLEYKMNSLVSTQFLSTVNRQLRDEEINEHQDAKKAFTAYVKNLSISENIKKKLLKAAQEIIDNG